MVVVMLGGGFWCCSLLFSEHGGAQQHSPAKGLARSLTRHSILKVFVRCQQLLHTWVPAIITTTSATSRHHYTPSERYRDTATRWLFYLELCPWSRVRHAVSYHSRVSIGDSWHGCIHTVIILIVNAIAILSEDRFLARSTPTPPIDTTITRTWRADSVIMM